MTVLDAQGRKFDNVSSLAFDWSLSDSKVGNLQVERGVIYHQREDPKNLGYKPIEDAYQILQTNGSPGPVEMTAGLENNGYTGKVLLLSKTFVQFCHLIL